MSERPRILVVDDDPVNLQVIASALKNEYDIFTVLNGYDAISQLRKHTPDLILLDVMMPELTGFDLCAIIKSDTAFAEIPVIFLTSLDNEAAELRGFELGGIDYLAKPVNLVLLKLRVRNHIALKERNDLVRIQRDLLAEQKEELEAALARTRRLEGIIPICAYCKKIRDDQNSWNQFEQYITDHSDALFSHGICPECAEEQMELIRNLKPARPVDP